MAKGACSAAVLGSCKRGRNLEGDRICKWKEFRDCFPSLLILFVTSSGVIKEFIGLSNSRLTMSWTINLHPLPLVNPVVPT